jgi:hypothetical protein
VAAICLLVGVSTGACGTQPTQASDLTAGHRAELVTLGGARLEAEREQQVTFRAASGRLKVVAEVTGATPALTCALSRFVGEGDAGRWVAVPLSSHSSPGSGGTVFTLKSSPLEPGAYRLTYTGHGRLKFLGVGVNY